MTFDAREARLMTPGETKIFDAYPGLRMEASEKFRTWGYRYKSPVTGQMKQLKIGRWPELSWHSAVVEWEKLKKRRDEGEDPAAAKRSKAIEQEALATATKLRVKQEGYTVRQACVDYHRELIMPRWSRKNQLNISALLASVSPDVLDMRAEDLDRATAFNLIQQKAMNTPTQALKLRTHLNAAFNYAIDAGRVPESTPNWWGKVLRGKIRTKGKKIDGKHVGVVKRVLSEEEIGTLINWLPNFTRLIEEVITIYLWTGTRGSEICASVGREVVEEAPGEWWWTIPVEKTKNRHRDQAVPLRVPLFGRAKDIMVRRKAYYGDAAPLFPQTGNINTPIEQHYICVQVLYRQPYSTIKPTINRTRLTVTRWAPHDLRRTARTTLAKLGCPRDVAEVIVGHLLRGVEGIYNLHTYNEERKEWLLKLSNHLEELAAKYRTTP